MAKQPQLQYTPYQMADILQDVTVINAVPCYSDYGMGELYTPVEVHTVSHIAENPGVSVTQIAANWCKTKGAVSQMVKQLEARGLVRREKAPGNEKRVLLFVTEKGAQLDALHRRYDDVHFGRILDELLRAHTPQQVNDAFAVLSSLLAVYRAQE